MENNLDEQYTKIDSPRKKLTIFLIPNIILVIIRKLIIILFYIYLKEDSRTRYQPWQYFIDELSFINKVELESLFGHPAIFINAKFVFMVMLLVIFLIIILSMIKNIYNKKIKTSLIILSISHFVFLPYYLLVFGIQISEQWISYSPA